MKIRTAAQLKAAVEHGLRTRGGCGAACCLLDPQPGAMKSACSCDSKQIRAALFWSRQVMRDVAAPEEIAAGAVSKLRLAAAGTPVAVAVPAPDESDLELMLCSGCGQSADPDSEDGCEEGCWVPAVRKALSLSEAVAEQLDAMPEALASMVRLAHEYLDDAVCDHPKGECWCAQAADLRRAEALLPPKPVSSEANQ